LLKVAEEEEEVEVEVEVEEVSRRYSLIAQRSSLAHTVPKCFSIVSPDFLFSFFIFFFLFFFFFFSSL